MYASNKFWISAYHFWPIMRLNVTADADGSCRLEATVARITSNPVKRVVHRARVRSHRVKITANYPRFPDRLRNLRGQMFAARGAAPRHPQCTLASRSFFDGSFSSVARRDCRRTACNFVRNKGLTRLRTAGRFVPFRWHFIVSILLCPFFSSRSRVCSVRNCNFWNMSSILSYSLSNSSTNSKSKEENQF